MAIQQLTEEQVRTWTLRQKDEWWLKNVYRGDMPQLTLRAAVTGFLLGGFLSATNLYVGAKTGWSLGVGITSVILAFAIFRVMSRIGVSREFTILENNCSQSIATSAGYMTAPLISSLAAYMLIQGELLPWWQMMLWNIVMSTLGVLFAFPLKRRFINDEQHAFPEGRAAGVVLDSLHSGDARTGVVQARVLAIAAGAAALIKFFQAEGIQEALQDRLLKLWRSGKSAVEAAADAAGEAATAAQVKFYYLPENIAGWARSFGWELPRIRGIRIDQLTITPALDLAMIGAGGLMGIRAASSLLIGAVLNYFVLAPWMIHAGDIPPGKGSLDDLANATFGLRPITVWSLWPGVACMVVASFVAFFAKPKQIISAFTTVFRRKTDSAGDDPLKGIEFPLWISVVGIPVCSIIAAVLGWWFFGIEVWVSLVGLPLAFVLALVAANSTALTGTTPVGATSKITQLFYGVVQPGDKAVNVATASITGEVVSNASNLLMDIKPGYMLGAKPRQQAIGHIIGIVAGALASVPLFFLLFTKDVADKGVTSIQSEKFPMPSATVWKGVADVLAEGLKGLAHTAQVAVVIAAGVGLVLELARIMSRNRFPLSPVALGLAFVIDFQTSLAMFTGAFIFWVLGRVYKDPQSHGHKRWIGNQEAICAGVIAGAALMGIADAVVTSAVLK